MNLASLDLNLLVSLEALLEERSVTRAAARVGLSQPALSAALGRLRRHFGDELLHRVGNTYELTPLAAQLLERTRTAVTSVERVFASQSDFAPARSDREFTLIISDYAMAVLGPGISTLLQRQAPSIRLIMQLLTKEAAEQASDTLRITDGIVLPHGFISDLPHQDLYRDQWVCLVSADNEAVGDSLSLAQLASLPMVMSFHRSAAFTPASKQLNILGIEPRVPLAAESFLALPFLVAGTDRIALVQKQAIRRLGPIVGVRILPCPFDVMPLVEALWWHPMHDRDPGHIWLRQFLRDAARHVYDPIQVPDSASALR